MARGRLISKSLGSSRKFHELLRAGGKLGEFCQVLFPLIIANTDDFGRMAGDGFTVKNVVLPTSRRPERDFERALAVMHDVGLVARYVVEERIYLQVNDFDVHQPNLHKRLKSAFPENPGASGSYRPNLTESNLTESKGTEPNRASHVVPEPSPFEAFWAAYPKKKAKDDAQRAWDKRRPDAALLALMLHALDSQRRSPDWLRESGRFIPFPATWLNRGQWTDTAAPDSSLSETARYNLQATEEAEQIILETDARRAHGHRG